MHTLIHACIYLVIYIYIYTQTAKTLHKVFSSYLALTENRPLETTTRFTTISHSVSSFFNGGTASPLCHGVTAARRAESTCRWLRLHSQPRLRVPASEKPGPQVSAASAASTAWHARKVQTPGEGSKDVAGPRGSGLWP